MEKKIIYKELESLASDLSLLYVEDNLGIQKQASKIFQKFFKEVFLASDGQEGLELFEEIVTDVQMI